MMTTRTWWIPGIIVGLSLVAGILWVTRDPDLANRPALNGFLSGRLFAGPSRIRKMVPVQELSGITVLRDGKLLVHGDETATVWEVDPYTGVVVKRLELGAPVLRLDLEGITASGTDLYLIASNGILYRVRNFRQVSGAVRDYETFDTGLGKYCELEGLDRDLDGKSLVLICKKVFGKGRERRKTTLFRYIPGTGAPEMLFDLPFGEIRSSRSFHPSAIASTGETYLILSAREHLLVEVTSEGRVLEEVFLGDRRHPQPEGLGILPDGSVVIGDEYGKEVSRITVYP